MTLKYRTLTTITAVGIGLALGWGLGTATDPGAERHAPKKAWKGANGGQEEFDLYDAFQTRQRTQRQDRGSRQMESGLPAKRLRRFDRQEAVSGRLPNREHEPRRPLTRPLKFSRRIPITFSRCYAIVSALYQTLMPADAGRPGQRRAGIQVCPGQSGHGSLRPQTSRDHNRRPVASRQTGHEGRRAQRQTA